MTWGNTLFLAGAVLELIGLQQGVNARAVGVSMILYGVVVIYTGYLS